MSPNDANCSEASAKMVATPLWWGARFTIRDPDQKAETPAAADAKKGDAAEELHRLLPVADQELDGEEIEDDAGHAGDPVLRRAVFPSPVIDGNFDDLRPGDEGKGRDEPMQLTEELEVLDHFLVVRLQRAPVVVELEAGDPRDE